jgi:hypothetical protein
MSWCIGAYFAGVLTVVAGAWVFNVADGKLMSARDMAHLMDKDE